MIISHSHKFIFIKSEKTAGTSLEASLSGYCSGHDIVTPINDYRHNRTEKGEFIHHAMNADEFIALNLPNLQHVDAATIKRMVPADIWNGYFKVSMARNPWDRTVSDFFWKRRQDPATKPRKRFYHYVGFPFNEVAQLRDGLSAFIRSKDFVNNDRYYILDERLCVDYVIRYEHLSENVQEVCEKIGLPLIELPRLKTGFRKKHHHYSEYFDEESAAIVAEKHKNDIRFFDYRFERL